MRKKNKNKHTFGDICDCLFIEHVVPWVNFDEIYDSFSFDETTGQQGLPVRDVDICPFPFYQCVISPDGLVTACCVDWERRLVFGNAFEESLYNLWNGDARKKFLKDMVQSGRAIASEAVCAKCQKIRYDAKDNLDSHKKELLKAWK